MNNTYEIGKRLKMLMKINNLTISELAEKADISEDTIKSIRSGKTTNPSIGILIAISDALSCTIDNLIGRFPKTFDEAELLRKWRSLDSHGRNKAIMLIDNELAYQPLISNKTRSFMVYTPSAYLGNGAVFDLSRPEYIDIPHNYMADADFGFKVISDSLIPDYFPNDIIALKKRLPLPGETAFYLKNNTVYIRKNMVVNGVSRLIPLYATNNETELKNTFEYTCIGTLIGLVRSVL